MKYYLLFAWGGVDPQLYGPYDTPGERDEQAKNVFAEHGDQEHGPYFRLSSESEINIGCFVSGELDEQEPDGPNATYTSVWDNGATITSPCQFCFESNVCYDIEMGGADPGDAQLVDEYVTVDGEDRRESDGVIFQYKGKDQFEFLGQFFACYDQYKEHNGKPIEVVEVIWPHTEPDHNDVILFKVRLTDTGEEIEAHPEEVVKSINGEPLVVHIGGALARTGDNIA